MAKRDYSIYVHIPFCKARCKYCAFSSCTDLSLQENYFAKLCKEIAVANTYDCKDITTMYWGGGTPSAVDIIQLQTLYSALSDKFDLSHLKEFTVECNPESTTLELLHFLKSIGVDRISFGLQSVNDSTLRKIGRLHNYSQFLTALETARQCGFTNINADLIVGLPESKDEFYYSVVTVSQLPLQHISLYALEVHDGGGFKALCDSYGYSDDDLADMYDYARNVFAKVGFLRYEVSNFAEVGFQSKHNLNYWKENRYFGFGAAASGFVCNKRYGNPFKIEDYINGGNLEYCETVSHTQEMCEFVMLGLRLQQGFSLHEFSLRYGCDFFETFPNAKTLISQNYLSCSDDMIFVPDDKFYVLNSILVELLPD